MPAAALAIAVFGGGLLPVMVIGAIAIIGIIQVWLDMYQERQPCG